MEIQTKEKAALTETTAAGTNTSKIIITQEQTLEQEKNLKILQENIEKAHEAALNTPQAMEHFHARGLSDEIVKRFKLGYSPAGFNKILPPNQQISKKKSPYYKYILPFLDENGAPVYCISEHFDRANKPEDLPKYYNPRGGDAPLFGEHYLQAENPPGFIFIVEGVYDAISVEQSGGAAIALRGIGSNRLLNICKERKINVNFIILGDNDFDKEAEGKENTGQINTKKLQTALEEIGIFAYSAPPHPTFKDANARLQADPQEFQGYLATCIELAEAKRENWKETPAEEAPAKKTQNKPILDERFFYDRKFQHHIFGEYLKHNEKILRINNQLHIFHNGIYTPKFEEIEGAMLKTLPYLKKSQRAEVLSYLQIICRDNVEPVGAELICFENGVYYLPAKKLLPFNEEFILTNKIPWDYNPEAYSEIGDRFLNDISCGDVEIRSLLEECLGYTFFRRNELRKAFILVGDGANGKSTFLSLLQKLLGDENICNLDLKELGQRFKGAELFGRLANIGDDISDEFNPDPALFKKITTGDRINVERKGKDPFDFNPYCKLIFSANTIPRIRDTTGAVMSRLCIIPFNASFTKNNPHFDPLIKTKLTTKKVMEYFARLGVEALERILDNQEFTHSQKVESAMRTYEIRNNSVVGFIYDYEAEENVFVDKSTAEIYYDYQRFCRDNGLKPAGKTGFVRQIIRIKKLKVTIKKIGGHSVRVFENF